MFKNELSDNGLMALALVLFFLFFGGMIAGICFVENKRLEIKKNQSLVDKILEKVNDK